MNQDNIIFLISLLGVCLFAGQWVLNYLRRRRARGWSTADGQVHSTALRYKGAGELVGAWVASKVRVDPERPATSMVLDSDRA